MAHSGPEFFVDQISEASLTDTGSRGDVARAFAEHDDGDRDDEAAEAYEDAVGVETVALQYDVE